MSHSLIVNTRQSESCLVTMVKDILATSQSDADKLKDLQLIMDNTLEHTQERERLQHLLHGGLLREMQVFPGFHSVKLLSRGGFGQVYSATHTIDGQEYAIKTIPMKFQNHQLITDVVVRRLKEVRCLARLEHPNIIRYYNSWLDIGISPKVERVGLLGSKSYSSVQDSVQDSITDSASDLSVGEESGGSLSGINSCGIKPSEKMRRSLSLDSIVPLKKPRPKSVRTTLFLQTERLEMNLREWMSTHREELYYSASIVEIMKQISEGVKYLHTMTPSIIHCDLKPENILLNCEDGWPTTIKVADFGLITVTGSQWTLSKHEGTATYKAPELKSVDEEEIHPTPASDIYSLGIMFFEMIHRFETEMERSLKIQELKNGKLKMNNIIDRMVATEPERRPTIVETLMEIIAVERSSSIG